MSITSLSEEQNTQIVRSQSCLILPSMALLTSARRSLQPSGPQKSMSSVFVDICPGLMRHHSIHVITYCIPLQALIRGRVHTVRGKGKSCFMVLRQGSATVQVSYTHQLSLFFSG